ncbi:unnamed protein product [Diplocarpon coronariae]
MQAATFSSIEKRRGGDVIDHHEVRAVRWADSCLPVAVRPSDIRRGGRTWPSLTACQVREAENRLIR